jgi:hypothetical protein
MHTHENRNSWHASAVACTVHISHPMYMYCAAVLKTVCYKAVMLLANSHHKHTVTRLQLYTSYCKLLLIRGSLWDSDKLHSAMFECC